MAVGQIRIENAVFAGVDDHDFNFEILSKKKRRAPIQYEAIDPHG